MKAILVASMLALLLGSCGEEGEKWVSFPHEVSMPVESALILPTGKLLDTPDFLRGDLILFKNAPAKVQSGCLTSLTDCLPVHVCKPAPGSLPTKFNSLDEVCKDVPTDDELTAINNIDERMGFTITLNTTDRVGRVWVKKIVTIGGESVATFVYDLLDKPLTEE